MDIIVLSPVFKLIDFAKTNSLNLFVYGCIIVGFDG